jgi:hypothetical protein
VVFSHQVFYLILFFYYRKGSSFRQHYKEYILEHPVCDSLYKMLLCGTDRNNMKELGLTAHLPVTVRVIIWTAAFWSVTLCSLIGGYQLLEENISIFRAEVNMARKQ